MIKEAAISPLNDVIATRVRTLRAARALSLDALAEQSGVSRSMISLVERGESSATAVVLEKLATALGVTLASLFEPGDDAPSTPTEPVSRKRDQIVWTDPDSGYERRNVSPAAVASASPAHTTATHASHSPRVQLVDVEFPAGRRVAFESGARDVRVQQQIWILRGAMTITVGATSYRLHEGDCLAMQLDQPIMFYNHTRRPSRYVVAIASERVPLR